MAHRRILLLQGPAQAAHRGADADHQPGIGQGADLVHRDAAAGQRALFLAEMAVEAGGEVGEGQHLEAEGGDELLELFHLDRLQGDVRQQHHLVVVDCRRRFGQLLDQRLGRQRPAALQPPLVIRGVDPDQRVVDPCRRRRECRPPWFRSARWCTGRSAPGRFCRRCFSPTRRYCSRRRRGSR